MKYGCQLYSCRNFQPQAELPGRLAAAGYRSVEGYPDVYADAEGFRGLMDEAGLTMPSGHFPLAMLEEKPQRVVDLAGTLGISRVFCPFIEEDERPTDRPGWARLAERLERIGKVMAGHGLSFGWHNHAFEFAVLADGATPMELLLTHAPSIEWEADIAWIVKSGNQPLDWISRFGDRISAVHVKDIAPSGENADEDGWADVGAGIVDWPKLLPLVDDGRRLLITEHDNSSDVLRFARNSLDWLKAQEARP